MDKNTSLFDFGYNFLGPLSSEYFHHLKLYTNQLNNPRIIFLAREGYFFNRAFDQLVKLGEFPNHPNNYLYVSRSFLFRINIADVDTWQFSLNYKFKGTLSKILLGRFGFKLDLVKQVFSQKQLEQKWVLPRELDELTNFLNQYIGELGAMVRESRHAYLDYLRGFDFNASQDLVFVDIGYSGTIQKLLTHMLELDTHGVYLITTNGGANTVGRFKAHMKHVVKDQVSMGDGYKMLDRSLFLESLLTAPDGQLMDVVKLPVESGKSFDFLFGRPAYTQRNFHELDRVMQGAEDATCHYLTHGIRFSIDELEELYESFVSNRHMLPRVSWSLFEIDDAISGHGNVNPLQLFGM
ncbi:HAD family hydrolase [Neptunicella marina]|uniref:HAD family hydrolase n=1 Tax=Neptunicella marina TaxID=2125989 RepID=A0A8J6IPZ1_9ALTE|nr:HAD family hydrolase [Neptunicella marina]MBC3764926.1 HAD family hydrolase [Neptunicella marina]